MIIIPGDYDYENKKIILVILSKKNFKNSEIFVCDIKLEILNIKKNNVTKIILDLGKFEIDNISIKIYNNSKLIESINNLNLLRIFDNVNIVNCDSRLGLEKNLWDKLKNCKSKYIIHCGDQIYNDKIFKNYYRNYDLDKKSLKKLKNEVFNNYYYQFKRYKNILKNNLHLMIPDDHEIVDDVFELKHRNEKKFKIIKNIFEEFVKNIELSLKFSNDDIYYLTDNINKTIYVLNYEIEFNEKILNNYNFDNKILTYDNIIIVSRKSLLSTKNNVFNQFIFSNDKITKVDIDILLKKAIDVNKKFYIFCGDDHSYKRSILIHNNIDICEIITCGPINTVPELFKNEIFLNTKLDKIQIKNISYDLANNFIKIQYKNNKMIVKNNLKKKSILYYLADNMMNVYNLI